MKKIFDKWENISIKYKLFSITTGILVAFAAIIYITLYSLLPLYYHEYKINLLKESITSLGEDFTFEGMEDLEKKLDRMAKEQNLGILLKDHRGKIVYGKNEVLLLKYNRFMPSNHSNEYSISVPIYTKDSEVAYQLDIVMPLQPIDEASAVIRNIMPYILLLALLIATIGAYIYSNVITKPLINIIESEREEESRRKDFIATISHELKTPITIISGQIEGMIYNVGKYKDRDTYLRKSYESTQELKCLVNEMIEVSKAEILEQDLHLTKINMSELLHTLVKRQIFLIEEKHINTILEIEEGVEIQADRERITKVINNIINNAIKYSPEGENIIIRLNKRKSSKASMKNIYNRVSLEVENTGVTIEKKHLNEIFNPFYRIEKSRSRKTGGSGLGLYIVSKILQSHGFEYSIKNKSNSVIFTIQFQNE